MARVMVRRYRGVEIEVVARGRAPATREGATAKLRVDVLRYTGSGRRARVSRERRFWIQIECQGPCEGESKESERRNKSSVQACFHSTLHY